jgi:hypothetical protein
MRFLLSGIVLGVVSTPTWAVIDVIKLSDSQANDLIRNKEIAAEGRIGNNTMSGDFEVGLQRPDGNSYFSTGQAVWTNGTATAFRISYESSSKTLTYTTNGVTLRQVLEQGQMTDLFLRQRSGGASTMHLQNVRLNGVEVRGIDATVNKNGADVFWISRDELGFNLFEQDWDLTGESLFAWTGGQPQRSELAYQVKVSQAVPEPATLLALSGGFALLARRRRR